VCKTPWQVERGVPLVATHSTAEPLFFLLALKLSIYRKLLIMVWLPVGLLIAAVSQQLLIISASTLTLRTNWIRVREGTRTTHTLIDIGSVANDALIWFSVGTVIMQLVGTINGRDMSRNVVMPRRQHVGEAPKKWSHTLGL